MMEQHRVKDNGSKPEQYKVKCIDMDMEVNEDTTQNNSIDGTGQNIIENDIVTASTNITMDITESTDGTSNIVGTNRQSTDIQKIIVGKMEQLINERNPNVVCTQSESSFSCLNNNIGSFNVVIEVERAGSKVIILQENDLMETSLSDTEQTNSQLPCVTFVESNQSAIISEESNTNMETEECILIPVTDDISQNWSRTVTLMDHQHLESSDSAIDMQDQNEYNPFIVGVQEFIRNVPVIMECVEQSVESVGHSVVKADVSPNCQEKSEIEDYEINEPGLSSAGENQSPDIEWIQCWTSVEKYQLLQALKRYGSHDVMTIAEYIPTKNLGEILLALEYYKRRASSQEKYKKVRRKCVKYIEPRLPLARWAKIISDSMDFKELHTDTTTALNLIVAFEKFPPPVLVDNIDFKQIYHAIANSMEGKAIKYDLILKTVIEKCIVETIFTSKAFIKAPVFRNIIKNINLSAKEVYEFPKLTQHYEWAAIQDLTKQRTYNPLNIPENYLKPSIHKQDEACTQKNYFIT